RLRFRGRADYWQKYHSQSWKTDRDCRRLGYRAMAGETNDRPPTLRRKTSGWPLLGAEKQEGRQRHQRRRPWHCRLARVPGIDTYFKLTAHSTTNTRMPTNLSPRMHAPYFT